MDIKQTIERKRAEIVNLELEIEALEKAHKIMVDELAKVLDKDVPVLIDGRTNISWGTVQDKTAIKSVEIEMPVEKEQDGDIEVKEVLRQFSQL